MGIDESLHVEALSVIPYRGSGQHPPVCRQITYQRSASPNNGEFAYANILNDGRSAADKGVVLDDDTSANGCSRRNMDMSPQAAVVVHAGVCVDYGIFADNAVRLYDCARHNLYSFGECDAFVDPGSWMDQRWKTVPPLAKRIVQLKADFVMKGWSHSIQKQAFLRSPLVKSLVSSKYAQSTPVADLSFRQCGIAQTMDQQTSSPSQGQDDLGMAACPKQDMSATLTHE